MSAGPLVRVTDKELPRGNEVIHSYAARRGSVTLTPDQLAILVGRGISMLLSGATQLASNEGEAHARVSLYMASQAGAVLRVLGVTPEDADMLRRALVEDLRAIDPESL